MDKQQIENLCNYWLKSSNLDFDSVEDIFSNSKSFVQSLFFLHLSIEKALKALYVKRFGKHAPFSHGLLYLISECKIDLNEQDIELLAEINEFNLSTRYPDTQFSLFTKATYDYTQHIINQGKRLRIWILEQLNN